jgi:hypothetical protein
LSINPYLCQVKKYVKIALLTLFVVAAIYPALSQCAMCTAVADEASKNGSTAADGINKGVLYLFLSPYLIVGTIGFLWWRSRRKAQEAMLQEQA